MDKHKKVRDSVVALDAHDDQFWHSLLDIARENVDGFVDLMSLLASEDETAEFHRNLTDKQFAKVVRRLALYTADRIAVVLANEKLAKIGELRTDAIPPCGIECRQCNGTGTFQGEECENCMGTGHYQVG